jgi:hypothetical protein
MVGSIAKTRRDEIAKEYGDTGIEKLAKVGVWGVM